MLRDPAYSGTTYSGRTRTVRSLQRKSPLRAMGPGTSQQPTPSESWIAIEVPAMAVHRSPRTTKRAQEAPSDAHRNAPWLTTRGIIVSAQRLGAQVEQERLEW